MLLSGGKRAVQPRALPRPRLGRRRRRHGERCLRRQPNQSGAHARSCRGVEPDHLQGGAAAVARASRVWRGEGHACDRDGRGRVVGLHVPVARARVRVGVERGQEGFEEALFAAAAAVVFLLYTCTYVRGVVSAVTAAAANS